MLESFGDVFKFLADSGGYALIVGLQIVLPFIVVVIFLQWYMKDRSKRMDAREAMERELSQARESQLRQDFEEQLRHERSTQEFIGRMNDRYDATLNRVTEAFGENGAIIRQAKEEIRRNAEALNRNTLMLEKFLPTIPKRASERKAVMERTVTHTTETKATAQVSDDGERKADNG